MDVPELTYGVIIVGIILKSLKIMTTRIAVGKKEIYIYITFVMINSLKLFDVMIM